MMTAQDLLAGALALTGGQRTEAAEKLAEVVCREVLAYTNRETLCEGLFELAVGYLAARLRDEGIKRMTVGDAAVEYFGGSAFPKAAMQRYRKVGTVKAVE